MSRRFRLLELRRRRAVPYAGKFKAMDQTMVNHLEVLRRSKGLAVSNKRPEMRISEDNKELRTRVAFIFEMEGV